jgi:hypothetical protein
MLRFVAVPENYIRCGAMDQWWHYTKRMRNLSSAFKKPAANGNKYSSAGTAKIKPY